MNIDIGLWEQQYNFMEATNRDVLLECGIGYGKTFVGAVFAVTNVLQYPGKPGMIASRDFPQLKKAVKPEMKKALSMFGMREKKTGTLGHLEYRSNDSDHTYTFWNGTIIYCVTAQNYDSSFRGPNMAWIWADEVDYYKPEAFQTMLGRLRLKPELLRCTSSPKGYNFVWEYFYNADGSAKRLVLNAPTWDNLNLSDEYVDSLRSFYSPRLFEQECGAKRLQINVGAVFNEFDRAKHVKPCKHLLPDNAQLYFFTDYNISNYCGVFQFYDRPNDIVYTIGEIHLKFEDSRKMAAKIKSLYPNRPVIVIGDSTGNNKRDVAITKTNYQHFKDAGLLTQKFTNPPVESRIISANSNLYHSHVVVDPSCKTTIKDLELLPWLENGTGIDKSDINLSHASDAWSYGDWFFHGIIKKKKAKFTVSHY